MTKPVSSIELSVQLRVIVEAEVGVAIRLDGAIGGRPQVVAEAMFE